jgi:hypothetical protein
MDSTPSGRLLASMPLGRGVVLECKLYGRCVVLRERSSSGGAELARFSDAAEARVAAALLAEAVATLDAERARCAP